MIDRKHSQTHPADLLYSMLHYASVTVLVMLWMSAPTYAQPSDQRAWVEADLGNTVGVGVHASHRWATASLQYQYFTGRTQGECPSMGGTVIGALFGGGGEYVSCAKDEVRALSLLVGLTAQNDNQRIAISTGVSSVSGHVAVNESRRYAVDEPFPTRLGVPIEVRYAIYGGRFGVGLFGFVNLNPARQFAGGGVALLLGKMR